MGVDKIAVSGQQLAISKRRGEAAGEMKIEANLICSGCFAHYIIWEDLE
jgi:hypothetical protein